MIEKHYFIATLKKYNTLHSRWMYMPVEAKSKEEIETIIKDLKKTDGWLLDKNEITEAREFSLESDESK